MNKIIFSILIILASFSNCFAVPDGTHEAGIFVNNVAEKVLKIVKNHEINDKEKAGELTKIFEDSVDINWISKFVLGKYAKNISHEELEEYQKYYNEFLLASYIPNFKKYTGQELKISKVEEVKPNEFRVNTQMIGNHNNPLEIDYMIRKSDKGYKIFDIIGENISLIISQRSDFSGTLSSKGLKFLIEELKRRSSENRKDN